MQQKGGKEKPLKRANIDMKLIQEKTFVDFTLQKLRRPFNNLCLPDDFLEYPAAQCKHQPRFSAAKSIIRTLAVTNDNAECAIALVKDFSGRLTKNE